ncbi:unnamed protein product [Didymodactylos carnosus]|uniref:Uncharacterized protein n=1 Tax=Didymodactylos carnosus TaxID=1234261 RepID=A0A815CSM5_9BILA|nr:unnamed protein product [Didymodactylos carnosus]CAF4082519.1 unnamed protein product [Didymodactylos carnosus]
MYPQNPTEVPIPVPSSTPMKDRRWLSAVPLIAVCCLVLVGLLLAATIVLALIPLYLPKRGSGTVAVQVNQRAFVSPADIEEPIEKHDEQCSCYISS